MSHSCFRPSVCRLLLVACFLLVIAGLNFSSATARAYELATYDLPVSLSTMAREFGEVAREHDIYRVCVLDFAVRTESDVVRRSDLRQLAAFCCDHLSRRLTDRMPPMGRVVDPSRVRVELLKARISVDDVVEDGNWSELARALSGTPAVVQGVILGVEGNRVDLECALVDLTSGKALARVRGSARLGFSEWATLGRSAVLPDFKRTLEDVRYDEDLVDELVLLGERPHPLANPKFEFPIRLKIAGKYRDGAFRGNDYVVPVKKGEEFEIELQNRFSKSVHMKLLVGGRNTLTQPAEFKGIKTFETAKRVPLAEARPWVLEAANSRRGNPGWNAIRGFVTDQGEFGKKFTVGMTDEVGIIANSDGHLGLITAAVYACHEISQYGYRDHRWELGVPAYEIGNLLAVIQIRLVDASIFEAGL